MQNHPITGDPLFAKEMLKTIDNGFGLSAGPPPRRESLIGRLRGATAAGLRKAADRVEARPPNPALVDCKS